MPTSESTVDRTQQALDFITSCCGSVGAFHGTSDVHQYLKDTASEMAAVRPSVVFPARYVEHVAYAVDMVASNMFLSPPAAIASVYLATRFEFYFRVLSGKLNADGTWVSPSAKSAARAAISDPHDRLNRKHVSSVALAYKVMKLDQSRAIVQHCEALDKMLYPPAKVIGGTVADIGERIEFLRNATGHGHWGDISGDALFYGLMTAVVFYNQT